MDNDNSSPAPKGAKRWVRDVVMFGLGFIGGSAATVGVGIATDRISPQDLPGMGGASTQGGK